jgi:hypothetical protein
MLADVYDEVKNGSGLDKGLTWISKIKGAFAN